MTINTVEVKDIVAKYGTPVFVYDEKRIRENFLRVKDAFGSRYPDFKLYYAIKCNNNPTIAKMLIGLGAGIDAASVNEIKLAKHCGVEGENVIFSGNFLSDADICEGLAAGVIFNLDDVSLLPRLLSFGVPRVLSFRVNPGIGKSNVGHFDVTGGPEAKFGLHPSQVVEAYRQAQAAGVTRFGMHMMAGSCVTESEYFADITGRLFDIIGEVYATLGIAFSFVDLGGGLGVPYRPNESALDLEATAAGVVDVIKQKCAHYNMSLPRLVMEPGRYFVADAGYLLGRVQAKKEGYREIWGTDLGMNIVPRVILYGAFHTLVVDGKETSPTQPTWLTGQICEQTDLWWQGGELPELAIGDIVVMKNAGAYCFGMSYRYNGRLLPAEIFVRENGETQVIRRAETFEDSIALT